MSKHTPGPWWLGRDPCHYDSLTSISGGSDSNGGIRSVAEVGGHDVDEAEANARLIAAAPDLLAACEAALVQVTRDNDERGVPTNEHRGTQWMLEAAIAKAKGTNQ